MSEPDTQPTAMDERAVEAAARAICATSGHDPDWLSRVSEAPMWKFYVPEACSALAAVWPAQREVLSQILVGRWNRQGRTASTPAEIAAMESFTAAARIIRTAEFGERA